MQQISKRDIFTSTTSLTFLVMATTGVLLFFHLFESSIKELHEILGLVFVTAALLHVWVNWKAMKNYFGKKVFLGLAAVVMVVALGFIASGGEQKGVSPKMLIGKVLQAPIETSALVLGMDKEMMLAKFKAAGFSVSDTTSLDSLAKENKTSPFALLESIEQ